MSSVGQGVGMVVGGIIGFYAGGNVALGASIGGAIGGYLDPPKGPQGRPPTASELAQQTSAYGVFLGRGYGTRGRYGNVFWIQGNTLTAREHEAEGGKGGPKGPATYDLYGTFAVGFGWGEIDAFSKLWFSGKLVYDGASSNLGTVIASNENGGSITFYTGSATQLPDPLIQADLGAENTPAWRGMPYIVASNWPMADFGNTLAGLQVKAEIMHGAETATDQPLAALIEPPEDDRTFTTYRKTADRIIATALTYQSWDYDLISVHSQQYVLGATSCVALSDATIPDHHDAPFNSKVPVIARQSDVDCALFSLYRNTPTAYVAYGAGGDVILDTGLIAAAVLPYGLGNAVIDRGEVFVTDVGEKIYKFSLAVHTTAAPVWSSASTYSIDKIGASENYLFGVLTSASSPTSCTVYKFDRTDLSLVATYTQTVSGSYAMISVVSDHEFYTLATDNIIWRWLDGVASDTGLRYTGTDTLENQLLVVSPALAYVVVYGATPAIHACWNQLVSTPAILGDIVEAECLNSGLLAAPDLDTSLLTSTVRGYEIISAGSIRTGLEPLRAAWPFDAIMHGYKLKFIPRGGAVVATIDVGELGASEDGKAGPQITVSREMDSQLPRKVLVSYLDASRDYDRNTGPGYERHNTDAVNEMALDLGIVLTANEAAGIEEVLSSVYWLERNDVSFVLPPTRLNLEPSDVVEIVTPTGTHELRLTQTNVLADGRIECQAKFNRAPIYTPASVGQESYSGGQTLQPTGPSNLILLDVPTINDTMDATGLLVGMGGYLDSWPGGNLLRSDDAGQTWASVQGFVTGMTAGFAVNAIGAGRSDIVDVSNRLNFNLNTGDVYSVSLLAMLNGSNLFAYGAHGRWEIIGIQNFVSESDGSLTGHDLLRGRFGTEWAMTTHQPYDDIVLLDASVLRFISMNVASINVSRLWNPVTSGRQFDSANNEYGTYTGTNLKPLSPVYLKASKNSITGDTLVEWTRRSRTPIEVSSGLPTPLAETSEGYEVEFYDSSYTTLKRTFSGLTTPSVTYTGAQQITDFGTVQSSYYPKVYQVSSAVGRGFPSLATLTPPVLVDPYLSSVVALLHFEGANGSTTITDQQGATFTAAGNAQISTARSHAGTSSLLGDGTGDYVDGPNSNTYAINPDFYISVTIECSMYLVAQCAICSRRDLPTFGWALTTTGLRANIGINGGSNAWSDTAMTWTAPTLNAWHRFSFSTEITGASRATFRMFIDGALVASLANVSYVYESGVFRIGTSYSNGESSLNGNIDEFRFTRATRYTTAHTPPSLPFPNP